MLGRWQWDGWRCWLPVACGQSEKHALTTSSRVGAGVNRWDLLGGCHALTRWRGGWVERQGDGEQVAGMSSRRGRCEGEAVSRPLRGGRLPLKWKSPPFSTIVET